MTQSTVDSSQLGVSGELTLQLRVQAVRCTYCSVQESVMSFDDMAQMHRWHVKHAPLTYICLITSPPEFATKQIELTWWPKRGIA